MRSISRTFVSLYKTCNNGILLSYTITMQTCTVSLSEGYSLVTDFSGPGGGGVSLTSRGPGVGEGWRGQYLGHWEVYRKPAKKFGDRGHLCFSF